MKKCSSCGRTYSDDILFCPSDGTKLEQFVVQMSPSIFPGQILQNKYEIKESLNSTGKWFVYRGTEIATQREVAVKVSSTTLYNDASFHIIEKSLRNAQKISHPGWVKILDFGKDQNKFIFIVSEYIDGESLKNIIEETPKISPNLYYSIMKQTLSILNVAHQNNIFYQNLQPSKIMLLKTANSKQFVKILGLGENNFIQEYDTKIQGDLVNPKDASNYTAPEIFLGKKINAACDIYSAGIIFYQLVARVLPFPAGVLIGQQMRNKPPSPPPMRKVKPYLKVSPKLERSIVKAIQWSPEKRYTSTKYFLYDIESSEKSYGIMIAIVIFLIFLGIIIGMRPYFFHYLDKRYNYVKVDTLPLIKKVEQQKNEPTPKEIFQKRMELLQKELKNKVFDYDNMVKIPASEIFWQMDGEKSKIPVKAFFIDAHEVSNEQYKVFIDQTGFKAPEDWQDKNFPKNTENFPVTGVSWYDATLYALWSGKRLPTEMEWQKAASFDIKDNKQWFWGDNFESQYANVNSNQVELISKDSLRKTPSDIFDLYGNVWEWTSSWYDNNLKTDRVIRGGSFLSKSYQATATYREGFFPHSFRKDIGFRCVREAE